MSAINLGKVVGSDAKINGQTAITLSGANGVSVITSGTDVTVDGAGVVTSDRISNALGYTPQEKIFGNPGDTIEFDTNGNMVATPKHYKLFGFELDQTDSNPATCIRYIGDNVNYASAHMNYTSGQFEMGDWADAWFIKNIKPVMMNYDGTVAYELDPANYALKKDGTASDIADDTFAGNVMIGIPTVWYYIDTTVKNKPRFWFSDVQVSSNFKAYAHINDAGNVMDYTYMNAYDGWVDSNGKMRSISGKAPTRAQTANVQMSESRANNLSDSNIWDMHTLSDRILIQLLLILIGKSTDTQSVFGYGNGMGYHSHADGSDENGVLPAGTLNNKGLFFGYSSETNLAVKVFGIENFYGNAWKRCHGLIADNGNMKIKMTRNTMDGSTTNDYNLTGDGYVSIGETPSGTSGGFISTMVFNQYGLFPTNASGSDSTYYCDGFWYNNAIVSVALFGGYPGGGSRVGALACALNAAASHSYWCYGCGLSCKP